VKEKVTGAVHNEDEVMIRRFSVRVKGSAVPDWVTEVTSKRGSACSSAKSEGAVSVNVITAVPVKLRVENCGISKTSQSEGTTASERRNVVIAKRSLLMGRCRQDLATPSTQEM
jgi:hypothetical protein